MLSANEPPTDVHRATTVLSLPIEMTDVADTRRDARRDAILGIDIGGSTFTAGLVSFRGELIDRSRAEIETDVGPQSHFAALARIVNEQVDRARDQHDMRVRAIGVGCPGPIERQCETVSPVTVPSWRRFALRHHLRELTGLPVFGDLDAKALAKTRETGLAHFHSRSRGKLWMKGESSGNVLRVERILVDCDQDALVIEARPAGPTCHTGAQSCFYRALEGDVLVPVKT